MHISHPCMCRQESSICLHASVTVSLYNCKMSVHLSVCLSTPLLLILFTMGPFFIGNRLLLTGYLFSDRLNVEKERFGTRFRRRHAFHPMPEVWMVRLSSFEYRTKLSMFAQNRQNSTAIGNIIRFIHISLRYKTALTTEAVKMSLGSPDLAG